MALPLVMSFRNTTVLATPPSEPTSKSFQIANLVRRGITNAWILRDGKFWGFGSGAGPFDRSGDGSPVVDLDYGVVGLCGSACGAEDEEGCGGGQKSRAEKMRSQFS